MLLLMGQRRFQRLCKLFHIGWDVDCNFSVENFRSFDVIIDGMKWFALKVANLDTRFVDGLPTALIKPLSGSIYAEE